MRRGLAEELPVDDGSVDVVISNGVINLCPDKAAVMSEVQRVLRPGGRIQIADIVVHLEVLGRKGRQPLVRLNRRRCWKQSGVGC